jgi:hypothetical protein
MDFRPALKDMGDVLTLRITGERIHAFGRDHLILGLAVTAVVGIGRWWDDGSAWWLKQTGIGSLVYVFFLGLIIWRLGWFWPTPSRGQPTYLQTVTFVTLTALPGIVYSFPIEWFGDSNLSTAYNVTALSLVSVWRVSCFARFLREGIELNRYRTFLTIAILVTPILLAAGLLGFIHTIANSMGGFREEGSPVVDSIASGAMVTSVVGGPVILLMYLAELFRAREEARRRRM